MGLETSSLPKYDPRVDRAVSWGINLITTVTLGVAAFYLNTWSGRLDTLNGKIEGLQTSVAVMRSEQERNAATERMVRTLQTEVAVLKEQVATLQSGRRLQDR